MIAHVNAEMQTEEGMLKKFTFSGSVYFDRMTELGLYSANVDEIQARVAEAGMSDFFAQKVV